MVQEPSQADGSVSTGCLHGQARDISEGGKGRAEGNGVSVGGAFALLGRWRCLGPGAWPAAQSPLRCNVVRPPMQLLPCCELLTTRAAPAPR